MVIPFSAEILTIDTSWLSQCIFRLDMAAPYCPRPSYVVSRFGRGRIANSASAIRFVRHGTKSAFAEAESNLSHEPWLVFRC